MTTLVLYGTMGGVPFAGMSWQVLHYLEGFRRLGFDVVYAEDTGTWGYDPFANAVTADPTHALRVISEAMAWSGLGDRWFYRSAADGRLHGPLADRHDELLAGADILVNLTGATVLDEQKQRVPVRIYLETDPVRPQIELAQGAGKTQAFLAAHTHHFTFGENLGGADCGVPVTSFTYVPTRQPVVLEWWETSGAQPNGAFTTIGNWRQEGKDIEWEGELYRWSKHHEFLRFLDLPRQTGAPLELALSSIDGDDTRLLEEHGWRVTSAFDVSTGRDRYRSYIQSSAGEFTVAKDQNVRLRSGWFSDRSACYLAAGRPVVTQDTGFACALPTGEGLFAVADTAEAAAALDAIRGDYARHSDAAREIAAEHFRAETVLARILDEL